MIKLDMKGIRDKSGQATLSFVLLVGGIIMEIAIVGSLIAFFLSNSNLGERLSARAMNSAQAGVRDAKLRIARDMDFCVSCQYAFPVGNDSVTVAISRANDFLNNTYLFTILSTGKASSRQRKLVAILNVDITTGVIQLKSQKEQSVQ